MTADGSRYVCMYVDALCRVRNSVYIVFVEAVLIIHLLVYCDSIIVFRLFVLCRLVLCCVPF